LIGQHINKTITETANKANSKVGMGGIAMVLVLVHGINNLYGTSFHAKLQKFTH